MNYIRNCPQAHVQVPDWDDAAAGEAEAPAELCWELRGELAGGCRAGVRGFGQNICGEDFFMYQPLHLAVVFSTLSKKLNLKGNVRKQPDLSSIKNHQCK